ncbi:TPA: hypothetical protein SB288_001667 [Campylobacter coli]|nr:hypothetical protein [Campylobacter coli]
MKFIDYLKNKALNEMAVERKVAVSVCYSQFNSIITHLLKVYIGQDLKSALPGEEWERQINGFLNEILRVKIKNTNKHIPDSILKSSIKALIDDCIEDSRIKSLQSEIKSYNYNGTPLKTPKNEKKLLLYIKAFLEDISQKIPKGELNFKEDFKRYLKNIKDF